MKIIKNPTEEQLQRLMNLIALPATLDEEGIYDRFSCYGWAYFTKDYCEWLKKNYPDLYNRAKTDNDITPIECQFWWRDDDADSTGYEAFKKNAEYIYTHENALKMVCDELKEFYDDFDEYKEEMEIEDDRWEEDYIPFDSEDDYISKLFSLFKDVNYTADDEDFDFDAALASKENDDEDFDFDAALDKNKNKRKKKSVLCIIQHIEDTGSGIYVEAMIVDNSGFAGVQMDLDNISQLNGCKENDWAYYDENNNTFTIANDDPKAKKMAKQMDNWSRMAGDMMKRMGSEFPFPGANPDNIESKNAKSGSFDKQKGWKDVPDFDPKAKAAEIARNKKEDDNDDIDFDHDSFEKDFKAMLGDDFDFMRDIDD